MRRVLLVCLVALSLAAGCWSKRELVDVSFAGSMAVDWEGGQYVVSVNILLPRGAANVPEGAGGQAGGGRHGLSPPQRGTAAHRMDWNHPRTGL